MVFFWVFGVYIIPKWLIKVPGHIPILFGWFRELRKFCWNLVPETSGLSQKCFKTYKKSYGIILENIIFVNLGHQKFRKFSESVCPRYQIFFDFFAFPIFFMFFLNIYILKIILWRWGIENYTFSITKQHPNLILNFIYVKKHEQDFTLNFCVFKECTLNFFPGEGRFHKTLNSR